MEGVTAPWFGQVGGGSLQQLPLSTDYLIKRRFIKRTE